LTLLFLLFRLMPGSFTDRMLFSGASQETVEAFRHNWGLDDPLYVQYWRYMVNFVQLDPGQSIISRQPVIEYVKLKILNTFLLVGPAITFAYLLGTGLGAVLGTNRGTFLERYGSIPIIVASTFPVFFVGILLVVIFAGWLNLFPTGGMVSPSVSAATTSWWGQYLTESFAMHYVLPFSAVVVRYLYLPSLMMRNSVVEVLGQDFVYYNRITGLPKMNRFKHITKHSMLPVVTLYPVSMTRAIGGMVLLESVFNWPGIGFTLVQAVLGRDYPVVQFVFFLTAAFVILANFAVDIFYSVIDPRISLDSD
jgi:peptide/nickel transport system permease protein